MLAMSRRLTSQWRRRATKTKKRETTVTSRTMTRSRTTTMRMTMTRRRTTTVMRTLTRSREEASDEDYNKKESSGGQQ